MFISSDVENVEGQAQNIKAQDGIDKIDVEDEDPSQECGNLQRWKTATDVKFLDNTLEKISGFSLPYQLEVIVLLIEANDNASPAVQTISLETIRF